MNIINGKEVIGDKFAYDGCHKIYIIENEEDVKECKELGYKIYPISEIKEKWNESCPLRFVSNWQLDRQYITQDENWTAEENEEEIEFEIRG